MNPDEARSAKLDAKDAEQPAYTISRGIRSHAGKRA
jgi:hypothetical protein